MYEKVRYYKKESVDVCRNCHGTGLSSSEMDEIIQCPVCLGSGRVIKTLDIEITIKPYTGHGKA